MKKLLVILLLAFFTVGITSCAEDFNDTDPIAPEISNTIDVPNNQESGKNDRRKRTRTKPGTSTSTRG